MCITLHYNHHEPKRKTISILFFIININVLNQMREHLFVNFLLFTIASHLVEIVVTVVVAVVIISFVLWIENVSGCVWLQLYMHKCRMFLLYVFNEKDSTS